MLFIEHALHLADRAQGIYRHLPDSLRQRLITASIVYQGWGLQKRSELIFFDHSHCFIDGRWLEFRDATAKTLPGAQFPLNDSDGRQLEPWWRKIDNLDRHPLWELVFGMPPEGFGHDRAAVTGILGSLESRVWDLRMALHHWGKPPNPQATSGYPGP